MMDNFFTADPALMPLLPQALAREDIDPATAWLEEIGGQAARELDSLAAADRNAPVLRQWDRTGERVDRVEHHPAFERLSEVASLFLASDVGLLPVPAARPGSGGSEQLEVSASGGHIDSKRIAAPLLRRAE